MTTKLTMVQCNAFLTLASEVKLLAQQGFRWPDPRKFDWLKRTWPDDAHMIKQYVRLCQRIRNAHALDPMRWCMVTSYRVHAVIVSMPLLTMGKLIVWPGFESVFSSHFWEILVNFNFPSPKKSFAQGYIRIHGIPVWFQPFDMQGLMQCRIRATGMLAGLLSWSSCSYRIRHCLGQPAQAVCNLAASDPRSWGGVERSSLHLRVKAISLYVPPEVEAGQRHGWFTFVVQKDALMRNWYCNQFWLREAWFGQCLAIQKITIAGMQCLCLHTMHWQMVQAAAASA